MKNNDLSMREEIDRSILDFKCIAYCVAVIMAVRLCLDIMIIFKSNVEKYITIYGTRILLTIISLMLLSLIFMRVVLHLNHKAVIVIGTVILIASFMLTGVLCFM